MILAGLLVACLVAVSQAAEEDAPFVIASMDNIDRPKASNLLPHHLYEDAPFNFQQGPSSFGPSNRGRSDIEIEKEEPFQGYVYPKPSRPFNLPTFKTLDAASFASDDSLERSPRSPQRRPSSGRRYRPRPRPNFGGGGGGFGYPGIRPLPALYNRPFF